MNYQLLVFDWDGTLIDSVERIVFCIRKTIDELHLPQLADEQIRQVIGLGLQEAINSLFPETREQPQMVEKIVTTYRTYFFSDQVPTAPLFPGVRETLQQLQSKGHTLAIATGKGYQGAIHELEQHGLRHFFRWVKTADKTRSKPDPMMLEQIMAESGMEAAQMLMVGDTVFDMEMAHRVAMPAVAVSYGVHSKEALQAWQPIHIIDSFSDLIKLTG